MKDNMTYLKVKNKTILMLDRLNID